MARKRGLMILLRIAVFVGILLPIGTAIRSQWLGIKEILLSMDWNEPLKGAFWLILAFPVMGWISWVILRRLGSHQPYVRLTLIYFLSQAAKYLPGGIWAFPGRVVAYQSIGVDQASSLISMIREVSVLFMGAAGIGLAASITGLIVERWIQIAVWFGAASCFTIILLSQTRTFWKWLSRFKLFRSIGNTVLALETRHFNFKWLPEGMLVSFLFWIITGYGFYILVSGIAPGVKNLSWFNAAGIFCLSWCAGFVVVFAPAGLGARESALSIFLANYMSWKEALSVALVARLWWTATEAVFIIVAAVWLSQQTSLRWNKAGLHPQSKR